MKTVTKSKRHTSHGLHLFLSIITGGLWLPVWIWMSCQNIVIKEKSVTRGPDVAQVAIIPAPYGPLPGAQPVPVPAPTFRPTIAHPRALAVAAAVMVVMILVVVLL